MNERNIEIALKNEITKIFANDKFYNENGELVNINSYKHSLPNNYYDGEQDYAPYVITEVYGTTEDTEKEEIQIVFTLCVCDGIIEGNEDINKNIHTEDDLFHIKNKIIERFKKNSVLDNKYICNNLWQFELVENETPPLHFAGLAVKFTTSIMENENGYNEGII